MFFCARSSGCGCKRRQPKKKKAGGGLGGGRSASPHMHWMFLHLLAGREGNLNVFVLGLDVVLGRGVAARENGRCVFCDSYSCNSRRCVNLDIYQGFLRQ